MVRFAQAICLLLVPIAMVCCSAAPKYPWDLAGKSIPPYRVLATDNPDNDQYSVLYTLVVSVDGKSTRDDIRTISEKLIENLPPLNGAIIFFVTDPSEKDKGWTVARMWWGLNDVAMNHNDFSEAGDYSKNEMKIAMKGEELPGDLVEKY